MSIDDLLVVQEKVAIIQVLYKIQAFCGNCYVTIAIAIQMRDVYEIYRYDPQNFRSTTDHEPPPAREKASNGTLGNYRIIVCLLLMVDICLDLRVE